MSEREQTDVSDEVLNAEIRLKLTHLQEGVDEIKTDVREIKNESPVLRIKQLEDKQSSLGKRISAQETAGYVTSGRMWVAVGTLAAVVTAIAAVAVLLIR